MKVPSIKFAQTVNIAGGSHNFMDSKLFDITREGEVFTIIHKTSKDKVKTTTANAIYWKEADEPAAEDRPATRSSLYRRKPEATPENG